MCNQRLADEPRQRHDPPARGRLGLDEHELPLDPREGMAHREGTGVEVDVGPAQAQDLALPQAHPQGHEIEGLEPIAPDGGQEDAGLLHREG
jgi:hypothetical protein